MSSKAKFTTKTKQAIVERDIYCILCGKQGSECHHAYYSQEANYSLNRNNLDQGVLLCRDCHNVSHSCSQGEGKRQDCINYLLEL